MTLDQKSNAIEVFISSPSFRRHAASAFLLRLLLSSLLVLHDDIRDSFLNNRPELASSGRSLSSLYDAATLWKAGAWSIGSYEGSLLALATAVGTTDWWSWSIGMMVINAGIDVAISLMMYEIALNVEMLPQNVSVMVGMAYLWNPLAIAVSVVGSFPGPMVLLAVVTALTAAQRGSALVTGIAISFMLEFGGTRLWLLALPILSLLLVQCHTGAEASQQREVMSHEIGTQNIPGGAPAQQSLSQNSSEGIEEEPVQEALEVEETRSPPAAVSHSMRGRAAEILTSHSVRTLALAVITVATVTTAIFTISVILLLQQSPAIADDGHHICSGNGVCSSSPLPRGLVVLLENLRAIPKIPKVVAGINLQNFWLHMESYCEDTYWVIDASPIRKLLCSLWSGVEHEPWNRIHPNLGLQWYFFAESFPQFRYVF